MSVYLTNIILGLSIGVVAYTYVGYPLMLWLISHTRQKKTYTNAYNLPSNKDAWPMVTVVITAYNEQSRITNRLKNLLATDYPIDRIRIILVSDGSIDRTLELAKNVVGPITTLELPQNKGKAACINLAMENVDTPICVFTDCRQTFDAKTIPSLVRRLQSDPNIGVVGGELLILNQDNRVVVGHYWRYEKFLRELESQLDSTVGVSGAIYAARRELIPNLPAGTLLDDVYIPMQVIKSGYRVVFERDAIAYDIASKTLDEEYQRKVRTLAGNYQLISLLPWLNSIKSNRIFWQWISHKLARLLVPWAIITAAICCMLIRTPMHYILLAAILGCVVVGQLGFTLIKKGYDAGPLTMLSNFYMLNLAALRAGILAVKGDDLLNIWHKH